MVSHPNRSQTIPRPAHHLQVAGRLYPNAWKIAERMRQDRGADLPHWPDWCYLPMAGWYAVVAHDSGSSTVPLKLIGNVARLAALGAWRITQGIYRFHPDTFEALSNTSMEGNLPCQVFTRLPEWCVYIETPAMFDFDNSRCYGFFVHLEHDARDSRMELRFLLDTEEMLVPFILHMGDWSVQEAVDRAMNESMRHTKSTGADTNVPDFTADIVQFLKHILPLVFYLCSKEPEYKTGATPTRPHPKRTKKGWKLFPASRPRYWHVGHETGEAIARARDRRRMTGRTGPEPHIRRAHWHGFWTGPREGERHLEVRWLPPIPVNVDLFEEGRKHAKS
jgi:hypothetical protein